ncbi:DUF7079 family protein [Kushneria phyllosphaerae]|nr:hypothetical protein [Kushneria phyllosphaerae]
MNDPQRLLDHRRDLWMALAPLWLDREPGERDYAHMADVIEQYDFTTDELERIYRVEMSPVLVRHQVSLAGEWRSFDEDQLLRQLTFHVWKLTRWRRGFWLLFSGLTTMMTRHRYNMLMEVVLTRRRMAAEQEVTSDD